MAAALRTLCELCGCTRAVALHALITCSGDGRRALGYLRTGPDGGGGPFWTPQEDTLLMQKNGRRPEDADPEPYRQVVQRHGDDAVLARRAWLKAHTIT